MPVSIIIGAQWGDEGKGRAVDWLARQADVVARYSGGDNAGHTVVVNDDVFKLHLVPSGILHEQAACVLGNGMVINPVNLLIELDALAELGVDVSPARLKISTRAHMITAGHIALDAASEKARGKAAIGTTLRGIGPAYLDKTGRSGLRLGSMLDEASFGVRLREALERSNAALMTINGDPVDLDASIADYSAAAARLRPYLVDTTQYLNEQLSMGKQVLAEGAQGTLLDVDHGSYPYVTSSNPTSGGVLTGLGIGPRYVDRVIGVAKAFSTRVGGGPMPTELEGEIADRLRGTGANFWDEFGTTTGRPRRCGWLDGVMLRYAVDVNGLTELVLTKLDVLSGFDSIQVAVAYNVDDQRLTYPPSTVEALSRAEPIYETLPGWLEDVTSVRQFTDLPQAAQDYIERVGHLSGVPVRMVSVGPERDQFIMLE